MPSEHVDGRVKSRKGLFSSYIIESPVKRNKIHHFFFHVLVDEIHIRGSFIHLDCIYSIFKHEIRHDINFRVINENLPVLRTACALQP